MICPKKRNQGPRRKSGDNVRSPRIVNRGGQVRNRKNPYSYDYGSSFPASRFPSYDYPDTYQSFYTHNVYDDYDYNLDIDVSYHQRGGGGYYDDDDYNHELNFYF